LIKTLGLFSYVKGLEKRIDGFEKYMAFEPGHYYSPLVEPNDYIEQQKHFNASSDYSPVEIDFNEKEQLDTLLSFKEYYAEFPYHKNEKNLRYILDNMFFTYADAFGLYSMIRTFKPKRIIEIGSGFSSALILDTNEIFFNNAIELTFIDPNPERLKTNIRKDEKINIVEKKIQEINVKLFQTLQAGDFLLIDTSHVSKSGSDVNHIYFNILPYLNKGVHIHIHDIFFPFEYPSQWITKENRSWNELFLLRAFLAYSNHFKITYFNSFMEKKYLKYFEDNLPLVLKRNNTVCGGIWIKKNKNNDC
jgi:predicted O-methyltransferase YrrM